MRLDQYLSLKLISLSLNFEIQAIPIMGAGEENILKVINIFELYTEAVVKLRKRFPEYFPEWTMMVEKGEIPDHMKKFL